MTCALYPNAVAPGHFGTVYNHPTRMRARRPFEIPTVLLQDGRAGRWTAYADPLERLKATRRDDVMPVLERAQRAAAEGLVACGFISYEAASAFDPVLETHPPGALPLAWFALFDPGSARPIEGGLEEALSLSPGSGESAATGGWTPSVSRREHSLSIDRIRGWIAAGETYQLNYTFRLRRQFEADPAAYFAHLAARHGAGQAAWIDTGRHAICSLSPELFFHLDGDRITARPMKGTAPRGRTTAEDRLLAQALGRSPKDRAENVMIVDMVRNDLSRIARPGTVGVPALWDVERYPTLFQMTSTCKASTDAALTDILAALFPSASITGAPKVRTMQLIRRIETAPRGIYTGAIGSIGPGRRASFNVAIRTLHVDREAGSAEYGTGGGIVWDSEADSELAECLTKALVITAPDPEFALLETIRWDPETGFRRLDRHLARLGDSADYFGRPFRLESVRTRLEQVVEGCAGVQRVRLLLTEDGSVAAQATPCETFAEPRRLVLAGEPIDRHDRFLFHKTTHRTAYDRAMASAGDADDVLLWNSCGEITESTMANLVVERNGEWLTPPVSSGLLAGTLRSELLEQGRIRESVIRRDDLIEADSLHLISSLRGWLRAELATLPETNARNIT